MLREAKYESKRGMTYRTLDVLEGDGECDVVWLETGEDSEGEAYSQMGQMTLSGQCIGMLKQL